MPIMFIVWLALLVLIGLVWLSRHAQIGQACRAGRGLSSTAYDAPLAEAPRVSVLVAAKDEEENIAACVESLLEQDYPDFELIAINDRSEDRTGEILREFHRRHADRMRVVTITSLRDGWFGKNNAMHEGVAASTGEWLCFVDADCTQTSRRTLSVAVQECRHQGTDFLSILPVLITKSFWERIIQPVCAAIMMIWFRPQKVNDPGSSAAYANGAFMLMKRDVYDAIGGHYAVKTEINEDIHLARIAKQRGFRLQVIQNDDLYTTHMYASLGAAWRGWSRIFYGCLGTFRRLFVALAVLTMLSLAPWVSWFAAAAGLWRSAADESAQWWRWVLIVATITVLLEQSVMARFYKLVRMPVIYSFGYLLGAVLTWGMLVAAISKLAGATTTWRGTTYRADKLASAANKPQPSTQRAASNGSGTHGAPVGNSSSGS